MELERNVKLQEALALGETCGLATPAECVNNVILHVGNLFDYSEAEAQVTELLQDAEKAGIQFCPMCGSAMMNGSCYMAKLTHRDPV
jgi:hypothetical protein